MKELAVKRQRVSLADIAAEPHTESTFDYNRDSRKPGRGRLRAVSPHEVSREPTTTIGVGSKEIIHESLYDPRPNDGSNDRRNRVIHATFTAEIALSRTPSQRYASRLLTTEDFIQVSLATVRESTRHCYWPADVIAKFLAAEVVAEGHGDNGH